MDREKCRLGSPVGVVIALLAALLAVQPLSSAHGADDTGVKLVGKSDEARAPEKWSLVDAQTNKVTATVQLKWGFAAAPPGRYIVRVLPSGHEAIEIAWGEVQVEEGKTATVRLDSGVELLGRSKDESELEHWNVIDKKTNKPFAHSWKRWGFTPVPPGEYAIRIQPSGHETLEMAWGEVKVEEGKTATVTLASGVELIGRSKNEPELEHWNVVDKKTNKPVAHSWNRWGFTPVLPGEYAIRIRPKGHETLEIAWSEVKVEEGKTATITLASGVELIGRSKDEPKLEHWNVIDKKTNKPVAHSWNRLGFTLVTPGEYTIRILPSGHQALEFAWGDVKVEEGKTTTVKLISGIELLSRLDAEKPPEYWIVVDRKTNKPIANTSNRWGFTPLPPGNYAITKEPTRWDVKVIDGEATKTSEPPPAERYAWVTGAGRQTEKQRDPEGYKKLEEEIELAIRRGAAWLKQHRELNFSENAMEPTATRPTIGILALVHAGELERDPAMANRYIDFLLRRSLNASAGTYANSITMMSLRDIAPRRYRGRLLECAQWLVENQGWDDKRLVWGYGDPVPGLGDPKPFEKVPDGARKAGRTNRGNLTSSLEVVRRGSISMPQDHWDNSCTQFAVLGLHAAMTTQIKVPHDVWERVESHFHKDQNNDGGWGYKGSRTYGSMTCAGVASLIIARHHVGNETATLDPAVVKGMEWLAWHFTVKENPNENSNHYYYLYGLERVGVLANTEFLGEQEWYPVGARYLLSQQRGDGSWKSDTESSSDEYLDTCYAILFLRRATLPLRPDEPALVSVESENGALPAALLPAVELILDSSGSMEELVEGRAKIDVARDITNQILKELPDEMPVGLRLYGHWGEWVARRTDSKAGKVPVSDPRLDTDSELVAQITPLTKEHRKAIGTWLDFAKPRGKTPMIYSLLQAKNDFASGLGGAKTVVLISDGVDTCNGKLEDVAAAYRNSDVAVVVHVVGFDIKDTVAQTQLEEIARLGGGNYYKASDAKQLAAAFRSALELRFELSDEAGQNVVARGTVGGEPVTAKSGKYQLRVQHEGVKPITIELSSGDFVDVVLNETGQLVTGSP